MARVKWTLTLISIVVICDLCVATTVNSPKFYNGLLSDFLRIKYLKGNLTISTLCNDQLNEIQNGLNAKDVWAIKLFDASGQVAAGFVWGNNYWLGSKKECERVNDPTKVVLSERLAKNHLVNLTEIASPFPVEYKMSWAKHESRWQLDINTFEKTIIHLGLCLPQSCSDADVQLVVDTMLNDRSFGERYFFGGEPFQMTTTKTLKLRENFFGTLIVTVFLCVLAVNVMFVIIGSIYTSVVTGIDAKAKAAAHSRIVNSNANQNGGSNHHNSASVTVNMDTDTNQSRPAPAKCAWKRYPIVDRFFSCFSLSKNSSIITTDYLGSDSIEVIHGMRALGMAWIISGHLFFYGPSAIENLHMIFTYAESWYLQPLFAVAIAVDTYFVISGLVLAYLFFQTEKKKKKESAIVKFFSSVINRYLRLTPPYLVAIALTGFVSLLLQDTSQYWMVEHSDVNCQNYWWRNLFYIQNMYPIEDMCMSWSWFLAADFQCFCLTSFLLVIYTIQPKLAVTVFGVIFIVASVFTGYLGYALSYSLSLDVQYETIDYLYTPTYTRIGAYFIGVLAGWYLSHYDRKMDISKKFVVLGWTVGSLLLMSMIFGPTKKELSRTAAMFYTGLGKTAWSLGIAWFIVACACGRGGIVNRVLSAKCLLPYSRMSYTAYLINPLVIMVGVMMCEGPIHLDFLTLLINSMGFEVVVFTLSYIFMLIFENPFIRLGKLLQGK